MRALAGLQIALLVVTGLATVAAFPVWALVDEAAHFDYVQTVAEELRLPVLERDTIDDATQRLGYPEPREGLARQSYEAFQPPLYYLAAAPVVAVAGDGIASVRILRLLGLAALLASAVLLWLLAKRVAPDAPLPAFALGLTALLVPAVVVRTVTVSNAALELPLVLAALLALWDRRHVLAAVLVGLALLTRLQTAFLVPLLLAARPVLLVVPVLLLAPWLAHNLARYGSLTAGEVVRAMQADLLEPGTRPTRLLNGLLPEEWWSEFLSTAKRRLRDVAMLVLLAAPFGLALRRARAGEGPERRAWLLLAGPLLAGLAFLAVASVAGDWDFFYPRYLHAALPPFALFAALVLGPRWSGRAAAGVTGALAVLWAYLATVTPFAP
jgi:hypothetical protein